MTCSLFQAKIDDQAQTADALTRYLQTPEKYPTSGLTPPDRSIFTNKVAEQYFGLP